MRLQHFNTSTLQHFNTSTLHHFTTSPLQHFNNTATLQHCNNTSTLQHCNTSTTLQHLNTATLQRFDAHFILQISHQCIIMILVDYFIKSLNIPCHIVLLNAESRLEEYRAQNRRHISEIEDLMIPRTLCCKMNQMCHDASVLQQ